ncbi:hypothetical protein GGD81_004414 [Rhodobium orientis]|uniref:Uncharacterized protein n=1 Tax=Rhodobium orientis TaxID=34017 RepID=A0A327JGU1_9HYPH|nr:hypothetical protein [Rhodobium orientis]MBB4305339.1 hypothetical protein [Rhodobium orientis]MBK5949934.1 hypothetical protein [Rhodobium orientis]RAI25549.1 hypothetical protein CH339_17700 [Rhodobium orientis]
MRSDSPDISSGIGGTLIAYLDRRDNYTCCGATNLSDRDIGTGVASDGFYAIANAGPAAVILDVGSAKALSGIAIYGGYGNRDDGAYTLKDGNGTVLGSWTVSNTSGGTNDGIDSYWLSFKTVVTTDKLVIDTENAENGTSSFREIEVFSANSPEIRIAVIGDSYTEGYGDNCDINVCSQLPTPKSEFTTSYEAAPVMPG